MIKLHMVNMVIDLACLRELMARRGIPPDEGLALHHFLSETFGKGNIQPFRMMQSSRQARTASLYGYSAQDKVVLTTTAETYAAPEMVKVLSLDRLETKVMPATIDCEKRLGFDVRVRPVQRLKSALTAKSREVRRTQLKGQPFKPIAAGSEVDAFLLERMRLNPELDAAATTKLPTREQVYKTWLVKRFGDAIELNPDTCRIARYERRKVSRGGKIQDGPDVTIQGELRCERSATVRTTNC